MTYQRDLLELMPFALECGVEILSASPEEVVGQMQWAPERCTSLGVMHGGALMTLADSLGGMCAFLNLPEGATTSTIESKTNFFRGVKEGTVHAVSRPLHVGRTTIAIQTELTNDEGKRVAHVIQTQAVLQR
ncbi:MAG: PaaI family thioesterase [Actinomycetota bacterium]